MDKLLPYVPFLRFPLIINDVVALSLTAAGNQGEYWQYRLTSAPNISMYIFFTISILYNLLATVHYYLPRRIMIADDWEISRMRIFKTITDLALAIIFVALHVVMAVEAAGRAPTVLTMFLAFGALIACILHFVLFGESAYVWRKTGQLAMPRRLRSGAQPSRSIDGNRLRVEYRSSEDSQASTDANSTSKGKGDVLIVPGAYE